MFGLPGDFNLTLLDQMLTVEDLEWVGTTNELNASYAADAYARVGRRLGAVVTTFGVGELSAINGLAGSYAEDVPVVHIVGMPSTTAMERGLPLHHTVLDGDFERGVRVAREFTVAQAVLGRTGAATDIDRVLTVVLTASKPGFLGIPLEVAALPVGQEVDPAPPALTGSRPDALAAFEKALRSHVDGAGTATLLAGPRIHRRGLEHLVRSLADLPGVQVAAQSGSKAILDECHPASLGTYLAATSVDAATRDLVDGAELLIMVGTVTSDFTTGFFSNRYVAEEAVELGLDSARIGYAHYPGVMLHDALAALHRVLEAAQLQARDAHVTTATGRRPEAYGVPGADTGPEAYGTAAPEPDAPLDHAALWPVIQQWIMPGTTLIAEAGTSFYGALDLRLPERSDLLGQPIWSSIGYTLPAALGAGLSRPDHRPVLFIGDGSLQLTATELGTLYQRVPQAVVFLLENRGYTVERCIQSPHAVYQDILAWDWPAVPAALGAPQVHTPRVGTLSGLAEALAEVADRPADGFFITVDLPMMDAPRLLRVLAEGIGTLNARD